MVRLIGLVAALLVAVSPAIAARDLHFLVPGAVAGVICFGGLLRSSLKISLSGGFTALAALILALLAPATEDALLGAFIMGMSLLVVLDLTALRQQSTGLEIGPKVSARHFRGLAVTIAISAALAMLLVILMTTLPVELDAVARPIVAVAGGILCLAAVLGAGHRGASTTVKLDGAKNGPS